LLDCVKPYLSFLVKDNHVKNMHDMFGKPNTFDFQTIVVDEYATHPMNDDEEEVDDVLVAKEEAVDAEEDKVAPKKRKRDKVQMVATPNPEEESLNDEESSDEEESLDGELSLSNQPSQSVSVADETGATMEGEVKVAYEDKYDTTMGKVITALGKFVEENSAAHLHTSLIDISSFGLALANVASLEAAKLGHPLSEITPEKTSTKTPKKKQPQDKTSTKTPTKKKQDSSFRNAIKGVMLPVQNLVQISKEQLDSKKYCNSDLNTCKAGAKDLSRCYTQVLDMMQSQRAGYEYNTKEKVNGKNITLPKPLNIHSHYSKLRTNGGRHLRKNINRLSNPYGDMVTFFQSRNTEEELTPPKKDKEETPTQKQSHQRDHLGNQKMVT